MQASPAFLYFITLLRLSFSCTLLRNDDRSPHILGNVPYYACRIHYHIHRKFQRRCGKYPLPSRFPSSLTVLLNNKWLRIPYPTGCNEPSFLHLLPVCRNWRNDYK
jgi:hypothetical protein